MAEEIPDLPPLEADDMDIGDNDSTFDERVSTFTRSLSSSIVDYPVEHGRRYHAFRSGSYFMPNDELELARLDVAHLAMTKGIGEMLHLAPIEKGKVHRILDMGTGTGLWAMEMGMEYPSAEVIGNDLSPVQPEWCPPNVKFEVDDVESVWTHDAPFDFIFCRYLSGGIQDWPTLVKNGYDNLNSGGWVEFQDYDMRFFSTDGSLKVNHSTHRWVSALLKALAKIGRDPLPGPKLRDWVREAGFQNVTERVFRMPIGPWPKDPRMKELGMLNLIQTLEGLEGFSLRPLCEVEKWKEEDVTDMLDQVRVELKSMAFHAQIKFHVVYGQKP